MRKKLFTLFAAMLFATSTWAATVDLSTVTGDRTFQNGDVLQGTLFTKAKLSIVAGATVTLNGVNINWGGSLAGGDFAGLNCLGNATIILADGSVNYVKGFMDGPSGIHVAPNYTVTIQGNGTLNVATKGGGAAIGSGYSAQNGNRNAGNIVINGGTIYANGGNLGAGIGGGGRAKVGNVTINGGIIFAVGGGTGAGIGGGQSKSSSWKSEVGNVTISSSVRYLKATKGSGAAHSIGKGSSSYSTIGTIKVGNNTGAISTSPYVYCPPADNTKSLINAIGTVALTEACKAKIDAARAAYDALEIQEMRDLVTNYSTLTAAEAAYNQLAANDVVAMIDAIGTVAHDEATRNKLDAIHEAYDALTEDQKALVTNYNILVEAEKTYANLVEASELTNRFEYNYDCQRNPAYPKKGESCSLFGFSAPYVGYNGVGHPSTTGNVSKGPWKLEFVGYYHSSDHFGCSSVVSSVVDSYFSNLSESEKEAKKSLVPIFHLWQWNPNAHQYQSAAYGVVCAYAKQDNIADHAALFISASGNGCFLAGHEHTNPISIVSDYDVIEGLYPLVVAATIVDPDQDAADYIIELIDEIPDPVVYTHECHEAIEAARNAYDALTEAQKQHVTNYNKLTTAETEYQSHVEAADQAAADDVIGKINAIGSVTLDSQAAIETARNAYNALTDNQKDLVNNYETLLEAEAVYADLAAAKNVKDLIAAIGEVTIESQPAIIAAREAYEVLSDAQKALVDNLNVLETAEATYANIAAAKQVEDLINALPNPVTEYTQETEADVELAREEYNSLTDDQKLHVSNLNVLEAAEAAIEALKPSTPGEPTIYAGFTATAGSGGFDTENHSKLVDGLFTDGNEGVNWTKWCTNDERKSVPTGESEACWWVDFEAANPIAVTGYILTTGNDNEQWGQGRNPRSWEIKAKANAGDAWTTIATVANDNKMEVANFTDFAFNLDVPGQYKYFRFKVFEPAYGDCMQLCELRFTGSGSSEPADPEALKLELLQELWTALGEDIWTGYGVNTGVISYSRGGQEAFHASFMGGNYAFDLPFAAFTNAEKAANTDGSYTYTLTCNLPAQTGMGQETLHVTVKNGEIEGLHSDNAGIDMTKEEEVTGWAALQAKLNAGGMVKLGGDVTAAANEAALVVPQDVTVVLDLNGHTINRALQSAAANGSVLVNDGTLAIMGEGQITGGKTTGNGGGILNNGIFTLYGGEITGNAAAIGGGVYNNGGAQGFWMTGGLIDGNTANSNPAIGGEVIFNENAAVQIDAQGTQVTIAQAIAGLETYSYIKPVMPNYDELETDYKLLQELYNALGNDVWTGYGVNTGVISYKQGTEPNSFNASFMGGTYSFDLPFEAFTEVSKADNGDGTYTYTLVVNLPAQTGMGTETLHVTMNANGEITEMDSENAGIEMQKEEGPVTGWAALQNAMNAGGVIKLGENVIAENTDAALEVPAGKTVVLELNGFSINRNLNAAVANGSVIVNNGTLAIMGEGQITGGKTTGNGGGILNNGILTLYGGEITGNAAAIGGGVYNNGGEQGFWMTGGLIDNNTANSNPAIGGEVIFNENAAVQIDAQGTQVTIAQAIAGLATYSYIKPVMPNYDELETDYTLLQELYNALGNDVWTGYGVNTGVISYKQGTEPNSFNASFMGGTYSFDLPFEAFTEVSKADNGDGTYTYTLVVNLPAQTGMGTETLHVTMNANGEITDMDSENAGIEMQKEEGPVTGWAALQNAMNAGGVIKLGENVIAENTDAALVVPAGKTVVLELNGFTINRNLSNAVANGSVIVNNGTLAIMGEGAIVGGKTTGNGGGILNNGILTLYGGEITGNAAAIGGGVYNNGGAQGFWMTGGLIDNNTANSNPAIGGEVIFNNMAVVQINADGDKVSIDDALAGLAIYDYIKPVMPDYDDYTAEVAIAANADPDNANVYYSTFYDSANKYMLPAGVEAYVADLSGNDLVLTKIAGAGQVLPADEAVILKASVQNFALVPSFEAPVAVSANNDLEGVDEVTAVTAIDGLTRQNCYVLSGTVEYGVGFYRINSDYLKAHKAYVKYTGSANFAPRRMRFIFEMATDIENVQGDNTQSIKVIENGVLYIIKNGVRYNVQGQVVR